MRPRIPNAEVNPSPAAHPVPPAQDHGSIEALHSALQAAPSLKATRWRLARAQWGNGNASAAAITLNDCPAWPRDIDMLEFAGEVFLQEDRASALELFEEIVFQQPRHLGARNRLAELCHEFGRDAEANEHRLTASAIRSNPLPKEPSRAKQSSRPRTAKAISHKQRRARSQAITTAFVAHAIVVFVLALWLIGGDEQPRAMGVQTLPELGTDSAPDSQFIRSLQQKPRKITRPNGHEFHGIAIAAAHPEIVTITDVDSPDFDPGDAADFGAPLGFGSTSGTEASGKGKTGGTVEFFGQRSHAKRVVFVVDFSSSMNEDRRLSRLKSELYRSLATLPDGMPFNIIYYADSPWLGGAWSIDSNKRAIPERAQWRVASDAERRLTTVEIANMKAEGSTYWAPPLRLALAMEPQPDLIWLLSDGDAVDRRGLTKKIGHLLDDKVRINTIGIELGGEPFQSLIDIAQQTSGTYSIIMRGTQHSGPEAHRFTNPVYGKAEN